MKSVLMVAYHYPPEGSSSGVQRTLTFSKYLEQDGWMPIVLTAHPRAYTVRRTDQLEEIPENVVVRRAFALDAARHLSLGRRYFRFAALPDRWVSWWIAATVSGWRLVRKYKPDVLWSTYPIATAHMVGLTLHKLTGIPWVADFRDSMTEEGYPTDSRQWRSYRRVERNSIGAATRAVFTTPGAARMYAARYPDVESRRFSVIPNGYDERSFVVAEKSRKANSRSGPIVLLHSGVLYPVERDPSCFYAALGRLLSEGRIGPESLKIVLRSTGHDDHHRQLIAEHRVEQIVALAPRVSYQEALKEMLEVDGLLIFQAANCNHQVPAKIYEYMRARKPILALTDPRGDTAQLLRDASLSAIVPLDDSLSIARVLVQFIDDVRSGEAAIATDQEIAKHSRRAGTKALGRLFDDASAEGVS